ncbi:MAG: DNA polymerase III subunit alpha, partial [Gemmatimonadales bacterium]
VYQEQVMRIANILAGFSLAQADVLRKAVGKKIAELIRKELGTFVEQSVERGVERAIAVELADQIETFGRYGFNKSHSAAYSLLSYHTAWLKAHYPAEFMAALLSSVLDKTDDVVKYIGECRDLPRWVEGLNEPVEVLPPHVNESGWKFTSTDGLRIRFGLGAVRGVGAGAVQSILAARQEGGPFSSLFEFLERVDTRALNKRACEALVSAGALDGFGDRAQLVAGLDAAYSEVQTRRAEAEAGQASLFDAGGDATKRPDPELPAVPEWPEQDRLAREKESLGFFISGHPLDRYHELVRAFGPANSSNLAEFRGQEVEFACVVTKVTRQLSRKDKTEWGKVIVEDFWGTAQVLGFRDTWASVRGVLEQDAAVVIRGKVSDSDRDAEDPPVFLDAAEPLEAIRTSGRVALALDVERGQAFPEGFFPRVREALEAHPGPAPVVLRVGPGNGSAPRLQSRTLRVDPNREALEAMAELFGSGRVRMERM